MALVSILSTLAIPLFTNVLENYKLSVEANHLAFVLRTSRNKAILNNKAITIKFYTADNSYLINKNTYYRLKPGIEYVGTTTFPSGVDRVSYCSFLPSGAPNSGGTVVFKNSNGEKRYIIVNPVAGRVRISDHPPNNW